MSKISTAERKEQAIERQKKYNSLSIAEKIKLAKSRNGNSKKEIDRLTVILKKANKEGE